MIDDRLPMLMVILDGLGDRPSEVLGDRTPCEAASTPVLDALTRRGMSGVHVPFGPGRATSSEMAHWALFGLSDIPFPGRAAIEAMGVGLDAPVNVPMFHLALRNGVERDGKLYLGARGKSEKDVEDCRELFGALSGREVDGVAFELLPLRTGECVLVARGAGSRDVSDTDALFDHVHPWMRPTALSDAVDPGSAQRFALSLETWLQDGRNILLTHPVNRKRSVAGELALDVPVTKWASLLDPDMPSFEQVVGVPGGAVTDSALYRGLARLLAMEVRHRVFDAQSPANDMRQRLQLARELLATCEFVHVHVKSTDEAGHRKDPAFKRSIIEATDAGLEPLLEIADEAVVTVTGDHATPSVGSLLHSGDPTPFVIAGGGVRADSTQQFGEAAALAGAAGRVYAADILPLMAGFANRPAFFGHRPGRWNSLALPDLPEAMALLPQKDSR